jgi:transposase-like protein
MVISSSKPIAEVAHDLGIQDETLGNWVKAGRQENPGPDQRLSPMERARVKETRRRGPQAVEAKRVPEKSSDLIRADAPVAEQCAVIDAEKASYKMSWMCAQLGGPRSSF